SPSPDAPAPEEDQPDEQEQDEDPQEDTAAAEPTTEPSAEPAVAETEVEPRTAEEPQSPSAESSPAELGGATDVESEPHPKNIANKHDRARPGRSFCCRSAYPSRASRCALGLPPRATVVPSHHASQEAQRMKQNILVLGLDEPGHSELAALPQAGSCSL